jgi:hypothetical protein
MGLLNRITGQNQDAKHGGLLERAKRYRNRDDNRTEARSLPSKKKARSRK